MFIYLRAGRTIYNKRKQLYNFSDPNSADNDPFSTTKTTEVCVTSEVVESVDGIMPTSLAASHHRQRSSQAARDPGTTAYSVTITADMAAQDAEAEGSGSGLGGRESDPAGTHPTIGNIRLGTSAGTTRNQRRKNMEMNSAAWSYTKCAILFFTAMLITWIPSSANRVYSVINKGNAIVGLEYTSAFVLPLQGLWNCIIYIVTSWTGCKNYFRELGLMPQPRITENVPLRADFGLRRDTTKRFESESMTELQNSSRPSSNE